MTRKVSLWTMLLITFTIIGTFSVNLYISWDRNLQSKYGDVKTISNLLDQQLEKASLKILTQPNLSDSEKIAALNKELQPIVDNIVSSHPNYGGGYYVKQLNSIVAFGPNFEKNGLKDLSTDSKARNVYITAEDVKFYNYSQTRNGYVVANIHPLIRDNEVIGHTWGNVLIEDVFTMFKKDIENLLLVLIVMLIIAFFGSRAITKQYISNISIFKKYILEDKPLSANIRFSKELYEVYIAYSNSRSLQKQQEESIRQLAYFDQLTDLPNRTSLYINLYSSIDKDEPFALLFVDVDEFKSVNDTQGHHIGDQLLILIAKRIKLAINEGDEIFRFGGDEFVLILRNYNNTDQLQKRVHKILQTLNSPLVLNEMPYQTTISIGVSLFKEHATEADELIRYADLAMYQSKKLGKNQFVIFNQKFDELAGEQFEISKLLFEALANKEFELYYQPQISLQHSTISGIEALIRWHHPTKGFISPVKFIPIAENNGFIIQLGQMILLEACKMRKTLLDNGVEHIRVAVNISVKQFQQDDFVEQILSILQATGLEGRYLELEITESVAMEAPEVVIDKLQQLKAQNIHVSIDDFGMGYSSLNYLKELPIQQLKIDRAFIQDIDQHNDYTIVKTIISMAKTLSLQVVAEGVETELQLNMLKDLKCTHVQGYYFYKPMPAEQLIALFTTK